MGRDHPTMEDVAAVAGVSRALVSIVFREVPGASEETRSRVLAAAAHLGYEPDRRASRLGRTRTRMVGVVFSFGGDFHAEVIDGVYAEAVEHGYEVVLSAVTARRDESAAVRAVLAERCEGIILIGPQLPSAQIAQLAGRLPTVVLLRHLRLADVDEVRTDENAAMSLLVDHLTGLGHRRILHLDGGRAAGSTQRRQGFRAAASRHGLTARVLPSGLDEQEGAIAAEAVLRSTGGDRPTAIAAFNDRCAVGVLYRLGAEGLRVPGHLSLTGFDDIPAAGYRHLQLTTIRQDADRLGRQAVQLLRDRLDGERGPTSTHLVPPRLIVRATTSVPP